MSVRQDLVIRQGETWSFAWTKHDGAGAPVDLTGYTARAALRRAVRTPADAYLSTGADAKGGTLSLGGATGVVTLAMSAAETSALGAVTSVEDRLWGEQGCDASATIEFLYDLELVSAAGVVTRELEGRAVVIRGVTS